MKLTAILPVVAVLTLGACAVDSQMRYVSYLPDSMKQAPPEVVAILRGNRNDVSVSTSASTNVGGPEG